MKLTHKAIARMAGYNIQSPYFGHYIWIDTQNCSVISYDTFDTEEAAWQACCIYNDLVEGE
jgi:hypothetical protein